MIKTLEELQNRVLQNRVLEFKQNSRDYCLENLEESTELTRGIFVGEDRAYDAVLCLLREIIDERKDTNG